MKRILFWLGVTFVAFACGGFLVAQQTVTLGTCANGEVRVTTPGGVVTCVTQAPPTNNAVLTGASANPATLPAAGTSTISWTSTGSNPLTITIEPGGYKPAVAARSQAVQVAATTTFTVTYNGGTPQATTATAQVMVGGQPPTPVAPTITRWQPTAQEITLGQSVTYNYTVLGTPTPTLTTFDLAGGQTTPVTPTNVTSTTMAFTPKTVGDHPYQLVATNSAGSDNEAWTIRVLQGTPPTTPQNCVGSWGAWAPVPPGTWSACSGTPPTQTRQEVRAFTVTTPPANGGTACPASPETRTATQDCSMPGAIFGVVDPEILGDYTAAEHDKFVVTGPDGVQYRTWHAQCPVSGRCYKHEHGTNPAPYLDALIARAGQLPEPDRPLALAYAKEPIMFGFIGRRMQSPQEPNGHEEAHEGFKLFVAFENEVNDENRTSKLVSLHITHMGTGGTGRFNISHHSVESRQIHDSGAYGFTRFMMDFGNGTATVCDPRHDAPIRDVMQLNSPCKLPSPYEIWSGFQTIKQGNAEKYRGFATPATFDVITALDPANRTRVVYTWSEEFKPNRQFPNDDWTQFRGCDREAYAQPGYFYNQDGSREYVTDVHGQVMAAGPLTVRQVVSAISTIALRGTDDGLIAYKVRRPNCGDRAKLGLKN